MSSQSFLRGSRTLNALCLVAFFALACHSHGAEYFVAAGGDDSNSGAANAPFKTVGRGLFALKPGDLLKIGPGTYKESCQIALKATETEPVVILGVGDQPPCIEAAGEEGLFIHDSTYVKVLGLRVSGASRAGLRVANCDRIDIDGCQIVDNGSYGVQVSLSDHVTIAHCEISGTKEGDAVYASATEHIAVTDGRINDNAGCGVYLAGNASEGGDGLVTGATVARNIMKNNGSNGADVIRFEGVEKSFVENNVCDLNLGGGIVACKGGGARAGSRNRIAINVVRFDAGKGLYGIRLADGSTNARLEQNTIVIGNGPALSVDEASAKGFKSSFNFFPSPGGKVFFHWKGETLDLPGWQQATGQDQDSHLGSQESPQGPPAGPEVPAASDAAAE